MKDRTWEVEMSSNWGNFFTFIEKCVYLFWDYLVAYKQGCSFYRVSILTFPSLILHSVAIWYYIIWPKSANAR